MTAKRGGVALFVPHLGCPHRCAFCDQTTITGRVTPPTPDDVAALCETALAQNNDRALELDFFGGSFTALEERYMLALLEAAAPYLGPGKLTGIRVSTRPDAVDARRLALLKAYGVRAVELGAQSMDEAVLARCRRGHTAAETARAAALIQEAGLSLALQMMLGLPGADEKSDLATARALIALGPDAARLYPTLVLAGTALADDWRAGDYPALSLEEGVTRTTRVMELFLEADIPLIRVGLHPSPELEASLLAGPYHPALRELCEGALMRRRLERQLVGRPLGPVTVAVRPTDRSRMAGQHRQNLTALAAQGHPVTLVEQERCRPLRPRLLDHLTNTRKEAAP